LKEFDDPSIMIDVVADLQEEKVCFLESGKVILISKVDKVYKVDLR
jgi:hypothetical protein